MGKMRRGFRLAGVSWQLVLADPVILVVLFVGLVGSLALSAGSFLLLFRRFPDGGDLRFPNYLAALPVLWIGAVVSNYCSVVVSVMADRRLRGQDPTVTEGMSVATSKLGPILGWTLLAMAVGVVLQAIAERLKLAGVIARWLLGLAWGLATTFVIPVLALEDTTVTGSVRRSAAIFKAKWGESVVAQGTIGAATMVVTLPLMVVVAVLCSIALPVGIAVGVVLYAALILVSGALTSVVRVALYRYAVDGAVLGAFTAADLDGSFVPKKRRGSRWPTIGGTPEASATSSTVVTDVDVKAAAWYRDPAERFEQRWWDGQQWTDWVRSNDATSQDPDGSSWT